VATDAAEEEKELYGADLIFFTIYCTKKPKRYIKNFTRQGG
jgi:hypothetical protein